MSHNDEATPGTLGWLSTGKHVDKISSEICRFLKDAREGRVSQELVDVPVCGVDS